VLKTIQVRNIPDELHRTLKARAARLGMTLSDYLLSEIEQIAESRLFPSSSNA
jgi:plasmid stability protein